MFKQGEPVFGNIGRGLRPSEIEEFITIPVGQDKDCLLVNQITIASGFSTIAIAPNHDSELF